MPFGSLVAANFKCLTEGVVGALTSLQLGGSDRRIVGDQS